MADESKNTARNAQLPHPTPDPAVTTTLGDAPVAKATISDTDDAP